MIPLISNLNVDNSDPTNFPDGRIKDNTGSGNGTPVNRNVYGDLHANISKLMRLYAIAPNGLPDSEGNNYQIIEALRALASKNDFIYPLTTDGTLLNIDIKLASMLENEFLVCLASTDKTAETQIKGTGATIYTVTYSGNFKAGEYVRVIKTGVGVSIIRVADWNSLNAMATELLFLKKATQDEENDGDSDEVATTPLVNKVTFTKRVNGDDSDDYLAKPTGDPDERNGLLSHEDKLIIDNIGANPMKNFGTITLDPGASVGAIAKTGDFTAAVAASPSSSDTVVTVTMANAMTGSGSDYYIRPFIRSLSPNINIDNDICCPVWKQVSNTTFEIAFREVTAIAQSIMVYIEVIQL